MLFFFLWAGSAFAQEPPRLFDRCAACHSVIAPDGRTLVAGGRIGPNLFGIAGRAAGAQPGFNYSVSMREARDRGLVWTERAFTEYLRNPTEFLKTYLGDPSARARMAFRIDRGAPDIYRYLQQLSR